MQQITGRVQNQQENSSTKKSILESDNYRIINNAIEVKKYCRNTKIRDKVRTELGIGKLMI